MENTIIDVGPSPFGGPENSFTMKDHAISLTSFEPTRTLILNNGKQEAVTDFGGDEVTYSGDLPVDESAKLLFDAVFQRLKPRCKTCCWFETGSWHLCGCPKMVYGYGKDEPDQDGLAVEDVEGWGMHPKPDFECIHHKEKS